MAKKKLLNEAQVRRFMGLAGMKPITVSNIINEMYTEEDPDPADAEAPELDAAGEDADMDMGEPMGAAAGEVGDEDREVSIDEEDIEALEMIVAKLKGEEPMGEPMDEPMDAAAEEPVGEPMDDEEGEEAELAEVDLQLSEDEIVQEVARRVAKRIIKAKRAKKALDEALGRK